MPYDSLTTYAVIKQLKEELTGSKVNKIYMPTRNEVVFHTYKREKKELLINVSSNAPRVHFIDGYNASMQAPPTFCMVLRKYLSGSIVKEVSGENFDRIIKINFETIDMLGDYKELELIVEIMGRNSNMCLTDRETGIIIDCIKHIGENKSSYREVVPKVKYIAPPSDRLNPLGFEIYAASDKLLGCIGKKISKALQSTFNGISPIVLKELVKSGSLDSQKKVDSLNYEEAVEVCRNVEKYFNDIEDKLSYNIYYCEDKNIDYAVIDIKSYEEYNKKAYDNPSKMIEDFYYAADTSSRLKSVYSSLYSTLETTLAREKNKLRRREEELESAENSEVHNLKGQIILSNLYKIKKGDTELTTENFFEGGELITIKLNPALSPSDNANKYFKKYNKGISALKHLEKLIEENKERIYFLESQMVYLNAATTYEEVEEIKEVLTIENIIKKSKKKNNKQQKKLKSLQFNSADGYEIYAGRNSLDNDRLTRKFARKDDLWLHTKDFPSSHVIIRTNNGKYSDEALELASKITVYFSGVKDSSNVPVDYTYVKYVKKPSGFKEGKVIYTDYETVQVTLSGEDKRQIENMIEAEKRG